MNRQNFNDAPIKEPIDDKFGVNSFAESLAKSIRTMESPIGVTIAINGPWGSGKSSVVNLVRYHLSDDFDNDSLELIDFKCWWFRGEEALTLAFFQELNTVLPKNIAKSAQNTIQNLAKRLLQTSSVAGPALSLAYGVPAGKAVEASMNYFNSLFSKNQTIEKLFAQLSEALHNQDKRYLVLIDDMDRLSSEELLLIFRLVKSVGRLPNIIYLLVFDRDLAERAVSEIYPSEGPHFLEKIIQVSFDIPIPARDTLNRAALSIIDKICGLKDNQSDFREFTNIFHDAVSPYLNSPRDLMRLSNSMKVSWPAVAGEVFVADYLAIETMRIFEPLLYKVVRSNKEFLCGYSSSYEAPEQRKEKTKDFLSVVPEERSKRAELVLLRLFPQLTQGYSSNNIALKRRVCCQKYFDTYFRMSISDEALSRKKVDDFVEHCGNKDYVKRIFQDATNSIRNDGKSKIPLLLEELSIHASLINDNDIGTVLAAIFEIADDIYLERDAGNGGMPFDDTHFRILSFIHSLTFKRYTLDERTSILIDACKYAQVGWLSFFARIACHVLEENDGSTPVEKYYVREDSLPKLKAHALKHIRNAAKEDTLINCSKLSEALYAWKDFSDDIDELEAWINNRIENDQAVSLLAKAFTNSGFSYSIGGDDSLGDRVGTPVDTALVNRLSDFLDVEKFRRRLEAIEHSLNISSEIKDRVLTFLNAWRQADPTRFKK